MFSFQPAKSPFDPADFSDRATSVSIPFRQSTTVVVNGVPVVENAAHTGAHHGKVLKRNAMGDVF
jgi:hypothetical protein